MARPTRRPGNLPAETTSFIGRRRETAEVRRTLTQARLITLTGPGGVGKTRLALRLAADLGRGFRHGAWLAELAEVTDSALVSSALLTALDLRDQAAAGPATLLAGYLRDRELLLVVDNCEHLLTASAGLVAGLLAAAPGLRVIATSREPLSVPGEHVVPVPPLDLPVPDGAEPLDRLRQNETVRLFTERAAAASGSFELTAANQAAVVDLCRRLDGLPLALELAAVRTRVLTVAQIASRLGDRFGLLTGGSRAALPRHQTLRTTIEWSHDLLDGGERAVLRRACVFAGRFTLEDVEGVCTGTGADVAAPEALDVLSSLVDKSLVVKEEAGGEACYRLHETMREFARLQLAAAGEQEETEQRCAAHYRMASLLAAAGGRAQLLSLLRWADLEIDNLRAVMGRCQDRGDLAGGLELTVGLAWYWITRASTEGMRWLGGFLAAPDSDPRIRAWGHFLLGFLALLKADPAAAGPLLHDAVGVARATGQPDVLVEALAMASVAENMAGQHAAARRLLAEAAAASDGLDYPSGPIAVLQARALSGFTEADLDTVRSASAEALRRAEQIGDRYGQGIMLLNLALADLADGSPAEAGPRLASALRMARELDDRVAQFCLMDATGCQAALTGQPRRAAQLFGAAAAAGTGAGANIMPFLAPLVARIRQETEAALGPARFAAEHEAGRQLSRDAAADLALGGPGPEPAADPAAVPAGRGPAGRGPLAKREADVARLVAEGLTNKEIGSRLFISERTVDSHVRSILNKLGFSSRAQIAAWMAAPDQ
ncbi:MAG TPA: LuxR C-terminal-related transcriptional regulator [Streptosporangiaceae bacterium]